MMPSRSTWALLPLLLSTFVQALPTPAQVPFGVDSSFEDLFPSLRAQHFGRLALLSAVHRCSSYPILSYASSSSSDSSSARTTTYIQPYPLESTAAGVALLSSTTRENELVPLRSRFLPDVPEDVLVMRLVRDRFEQEADGVQVLIDRSLTEGAQSSAASDEAVVEVVGSALAAPVALLHALRLDATWSALSLRPTIAVTLFSSPRFANQPFSDYVASLGSPHFTLESVTSPLDALPSLPPRGTKKFGFQDLHAGSRWEMQEDGSSVVPWATGLAATLGREQKRWKATVTDAQGWEAQFTRRCPAAVFV